MRRLARRLWYLLRHRRFEQDLADELALHRDLARQQHEADGLSGPQAVLAARRTVGSAALAASDARDVWVWPWLQDIAQDVRFTVRLLVKDRRFTLAAVLALGLGIGLTNSVFTVINTALIRDLPFEEPDRLVTLGLVDRRGRDVNLSYLDYRDWQETRSLAGIGAETSAVMNLSDEAQPPQRLRGTYVSANTFGLLRSRPLLGRDFSIEDDRPGAPAVVIVGYGVWQDRYAADPTIIGRAVRVNDVPATIIGVMPEGFKYPFVTEAWQPIGVAPGLAAQRRDVRRLHVFGRLTDEAGLAQVRAELGAVAARLAEAYPESNKDLAVTARLMNGARNQSAKPMLLTFLGAVLFVLLIACANVANLLLARAATRSREMAIRASLGATRWRVVRQLLIECLVLAALSSIVGLALSIYGAREIAVGFSPIEAGTTPSAMRPFWVDLSPDLAVFAFLGAACIGASLVFGLVPALQLARVNVNGVLQDGGRGGTAGPRARRWSSAFIVVQLALTIVLLAGAGLLARSFVSLYRTQAVADTSGVVTMAVTLSAEKYQTPTQRTAFFDELERRLATVPLLSAAAVASHVPLMWSHAPRPLIIAGREAEPAKERPAVSYVFAGLRYFDTLGLSVTRGRALAEDDARPGQEGAVVNERFAAQFFPGGDAIGHRIRLDTEAGAPTRPWLTIVGVVPTMPHFAPRRLDEPEVYAPLRAEPDPGASMVVVVRSAVGTAAVTSALRSELAALDADLPFYAIETLDAAIARSRTPQRLLGTWLGSVALIALILASLGVYALTAHAVAERTQEIGVRLALGARGSQVAWMFLRRTIGQLVIGMAIGLAGAVAAGQLLQMLLVQVHPRDPLTLAGVVGLLATVAVTAGLLPARRASRLDPVVALRHE